MSASVWVVGSGKGGVGKTFVSTSLGITLSKMNRSVLLVDFDLTGANIHTCFGLKVSERNLRHFFEGSHKLVDLVQPTNVPKLSFIQGYWNDWSRADISVEQVRRFVDSCKSSEFDVVIVDVGASNSSCYMELLKDADERLLLVDPEPTTIEKFYRHLESYVCYSLRENSNAEAFLKIQNALREYRSSHKVGLFSFREYLQNSTGFSFDHFEQLTHKPLRLIVNSARSRLDQDLGHSIKSVCTKYFDLNIDYLGSLDYDNAVWQSCRKMEPTLIEKPFTPLAGQFLTIAKQLLAANSSSNFSANQIKAVV